MFMQDFLISYITEQMMKAILRLAMAFGLSMAATSSYAWFWDNNDWECMGPFGEIPGCNPYDEWDPRYWMEEMDQEFNDDDDYYRYGPGYGYGGPYGGYGPYGPPPGYGYGGYGPGYGYAPQPYAAPAPGTNQAPQQQQAVPQQQAPQPYGPPPGYYGPYGY